jgi:hypothetical protein
VFRTRSMLIQENETLLAHASPDDPHLIEAMAVAAGRISQIQECFGAIGRIIMASSGESAAVEGIRTLKRFIEDLEKICVRMTYEKGRLTLSPLSSVFEPPVMSKFVPSPGSELFH